MIITTIINGEKMKKLGKLIGIIFIIIICSLAIFIIEESIRLEKNPAAKPFIIMDRTKYCSTCIMPGESLDIEYFSLGYKVKMKYYCSLESSEDNKIINVISKEFKILYKYRLWAWVS
jgi:hypothetical protein